VIKVHVSKRLSSRTGVALLTVVLIFFVLVTLLGGISVLTIGNFNASMAVRRHTAAFYAAESGITVESNAFIQELSNIVVEGKSLGQVIYEISNYIDLNQEKEVKMDDNQGHSVFAMVSIEMTEDIDNNRYIFTFISNGYVGTQMRSTRKDFYLSYVAGGNDAEGFIIDKSVLVKTSINMDGGHVYGNPVGTYSTEEGSIYIDWGASVPSVQIPNGSDKNSVVRVAGQPHEPYSTFIKEGGFSGISYLDQVHQFPEIILPIYPNVNTLPRLPVHRMSGTSFDLVDNIGRINHSSWTSDRVYAIPNTYSVYYVPSMIIGGNRRFTIDVGSSDITLVVDRLVLNGAMQVIGEGTLNIYLTGNTITTPASNQNDKLGYGYTGGNGYIGNISRPDKVKVFVNDLYVSERVQGNVYRSVPMTLTIGGSSPLYLSLMASNLNLNLTGSGKIDGYVVTGGQSINITGGSSTTVTLYYAPNAHVNMTGSGSVRGAILANSFAAFGGASVYYDDVAFDNFPFQVFDPITGGSGTPTQQFELIEGPTIEQ